MITTEHTPDMFPTQPIDILRSMKLDCTPSMHWSVFCLYWSAEIDRHLREGTIKQPTAAYLWKRKKQMEVHLGGSSYYEAYI